MNREITSTEIVNEEEIRFLREGDMEFQIEGSTNVQKFMNELDGFDLFDHQEKLYLDELGLEAYDREFDFKHILNTLDLHDVEILDKHSQQIN